MACPPGHDCGRPCCHGRTWAAYYGAPAKRCDEIEPAPDGSTHTEPCGTSGVCGPLNYETWNRHARAYLDSAAGAPLNASERAQLAELERAWEEVSGLPPWTSDVRRLVAIAQQAACLTAVAIARGAKPKNGSCPQGMEFHAESGLCIPRVLPEEPTDFPDLPGLPEFPTFELPTFGWPSIPWWLWAIGAAALLWYLSDEEQRERGRKLRAAAARSA